MTESVAQSITCTALLTGTYRKSAAAAGLEKTAARRMTAGKNTLLDILFFIVVFLSYLLITKLRFRQSRAIALH